ncbi:MAG: MotA/TolQ/ExbB proton channel family protein [Blastochloris sp.]|jgi:biopolymer transport protein ExbB|nr:MotA/TolQ/ExbB proton channel family protein [Blastochloris sp.]
MFEHILHFFTGGGIFMLPLILISLISVSFIIERGLALRRSVIIPENLYRSISTLKIGQSTSTIASLAEAGRTTLARLVRVCLEHRPWSKVENVEAVQTQARREINQLERGLLVLEITIGIGPLLGLLGTVSGLIGIFSGISNTGGEQQLLIAKGISEALYTTVAGLVVAIPSVIAHSYYTKKIESLSVEMETICMDLMAKIYLDNSQND